MKKLLSILFAMVTVLSVMFVSNFAVIAENLTESESNDNYSTADTLPLNASITGAMQDTSDIDVYKITASSNGKLAVNFNHPFLDNNYCYWSVIIYKYSNGNYDEIVNQRVATDEGENVTFPTIGVIKSETYYVKISNSIYSGTINQDYIVSNSFVATDYYEKETNNNYSTATEVELNETYGGVINGNNDIDCFKMIAPANGRLSIEFSHPYVDTTDNWIIYLYHYTNGNYEELYNCRISGNDSEHIDFPAIGAVKSDEYYVKIYIGTFTGCLGKEYSITNSFEATEYFEKENNGNYGTSTSVQLNKTYSACMNNVNDKDYFKVVTDMPGTLSINFKHQYAEIDAYCYWSVAVYDYADGDYNELYNEKIYANESENVKLLSAEAKKSETYYVAISMSSIYTGVLGIEYDLEFDFTPNDNIKPTGSISSTNNVAASQRVTLTMSDNIGVAGYYWGNSSLYSNNSYVSTSSPSFTKTISSPGTYYLTVKDTSGNISTTYSITFFKTTLNSNGGSVSPTNILTKSGNTITLPTPTKSDSTFVGWGTSLSSSSGVKSITPKSNKTYYAIWKEIPKTILGDVNGDGTVDAADAGLISRYDAGFIILTSEQLQAGDVNNDGVVDAGDAGIISRYDAGLITKMN